MKRWMVPLSFLLMVIAFACCSKPPEAEMQATQAALDSARTTEAETYAPDTYRMAADTLNAALAAKQEQDSRFALVRSYGGSKKLFDRARLLAEKATTEAEAEKERTKKEVTELIADAQSSVDKATDALAKVPVGKESKAEVELIKADLAGAVKMLEEARSDFDSRMYKVAKAKAQAVAQNAKSIVDEIEAATTRKAKK